MEDLTPRDFATKLVKEFDRKYPKWKEQQDTIISVLELTIKATSNLCEAMASEECGCESCQTEEDMFRSDD